jgi:hypothetical protein
MSDTNLNGAELERIMRKVRACFARGNDPANAENERETALRQGHALLAKYGLTLAEAEAAGTAPTAKRKSAKAEAKAEIWVGWIAIAVGKLLFCEVFHINTGNRRVYFFVGREENSLTASEMFSYLFESVLREGRSKRAAVGLPSNDAFLRNFGKGAATKIYHRCAKIREEAEAVSASAKSTGTALVLANYYQQEMDANLAWLKAQGINLRTGKAREVKYGYGYSHGVEYGGQVGLHRQVASSGERKALK